LPQLDVATFPSQIFWILLGFSVTYLFIDVVVAPKIRDIMEQRSTFVGDIRGRAEKLKAEAESLRSDSSAALDHVQAEAAAVEAKLMADMAEQTARERERAAALAADKYHKEQLELSKSSAETFGVMAAEIDLVVSSALNKIYPSTGEKS
jgi:F-type H+-transporting ATPase subunit b